MPIVRLPALMRSYTAGQTVLPMQGSTVRLVVDDLLRQYPVLRTHLVGPQGELRAYVNVFVNQVNIKTLAGMETPLAESDQVLLLPSISGGAQMR